jgi:hypothetical protein
LSHHNTPDEPEKEAVQPIESASEEEFPIEPIELDKGLPISEPDEEISTEKRTRAANFHVFLGTNPKTKRQKKAHARTMVMMQKPSEPAPLTKPQKKRQRLKKGNEFRKSADNS